MAEASEKCKFQHTYMWPRTLAVLNIIIWVVLAATTITFVVMLKRRYAAAEFASPRRKLIGFLSVFSWSFFVRGTWDLVASKVKDLTPWQMAILVTFVYFFTEWFPIFIIYLYHFWAFYKHYKMKTGEATPGDTTPLGPANNLLRDSRE